MMMTLLLVVIAALLATIAMWVFILAARVDALHTVTVRASEMRRADFEEAEDLMKDMLRALKRIG